MKSASVSALGKKLMFSSEATDNWICSTYRNCSFTVCHIVKNVDLESDLGVETNNMPLVLDSKRPWP